MESPRSGLSRPDGAAIGHRGFLTELRGASDAGFAGPPLRARFFGRFELRYGDEVVRLGRNAKALAFLKCLLSHPKRPVSQDYLMGWLWPESGPKRARWSLNSAIHALHKLLRNGLSSAASWDYVLLEKAITA